MLRPEKHSNLKFCVLNVAGEIIALVGSAKALTVNELEGSIVEKLGIECHSAIVRSLTLLFALGVIEFDDESDIVFLTKHEEERRGA